jgi:hypothetical protein
MKRSSKPVSKARTGKGAATKVRNRKREARKERAAVPEKVQGGGTESTS